jgi:hypothetical protein
MVVSIDTNLDDPKNIAGLSGLLGSECGDDLDAIEREIADGAVMSQNEEINIANDYRVEMERLTRNFDIGKPIAEETYDETSPVASMAHSPVTHSPVSRYTGFNEGYGNSNNDEDTVGWDQYNPADKQLRNMTQEERKQEKISQVLNNIDDRELEFNIEK